MQKLTWDINKGLTGAERPPEGETALGLQQAGPGVGPGLQEEIGEAVLEARGVGVGLEFSWEIFPWAWMKMTLDENLEGMAVS